MRGPSLVLVALALVVASSATLDRPVTRPVSAGTGEVAAGTPASMITRSYYMADGSATGASALGCANGDKQGRMSLLFGAPTDVGGQHGTTMWSAPDRTTVEIAGLVQDVVRGYAYCRTSSSYVLLIGVGTSNSAIDRRSAHWVQDHGRAWAAMTRALAGWAGTHYPGRVRIYGAWDAEPSWSSYAQAERWMRGYAGLAGRPALHANYSADGCPQRSAGNGSCNNGWTQRQVWRLSWEFDPALPVPQIYATSGANARQWHQIDRYGTARGDGMTFFGIMSQHAACEQIGADCAGTDTPPRRGADLLVLYLNSTSGTGQATIDSPTDIRWHS